MRKIRQEMFRNSIAVKSTFRGGEARSLRLPPEARDLPHRGGRALDGPKDWRRLPNLRSWNERHQKEARGRDIRAN